MPCMCGDSECQSCGLAQGTLPLTNHQREALRLLGAYTGGRFDIWLLAGGSFNAQSRAIIMSALAGVRVPQSRAGVNAMWRAFIEMAGTGGGCLAEQHDNFVEWAKAETGGATMNLQAS